MLVGFPCVYSLSIEHEDCVPHWCLLLLGVDLEDWILTAVILDPLIQGFKYTNREGPGKSSTGLGFLGSEAVQASGKIEIEFFIFLFKSGSGA